MWLYFNRQIDSDVYSILIYLFNHMSLFGLIYIYTIKNWLCWRGSSVEMTELLFKIHTFVYIVTSCLCPDYLLFLIRIHHIRMRTWKNCSTGKPHRLPPPSFYFPKDESMLILYKPFQWLAELNYYEIPRCHWVGKRNSFSFQVVPFDRCRINRSLACLYTSYILDVHWNLAWFVPLLWYCRLRYH